MAMAKFRKVKGKSGNFIVSEGATVCGYSYGDCIQCDAKNVPVGYYPDHEDTYCYECLEKNRAT